MKFLLLFVALVGGCTPPKSTRVVPPSSEAPVGSGPAVALPLVQVAELRPGIWVHTSWSPDQERISANGLIVKQGNQVLLVDTAWGEAATEELLAWISNEIKLPVARAVITHAHEDRLGGSAVLFRRKIPMVGHPLTRKLATKPEWSAPAELREFAETDVVRLGFIELFYPGPAHSKDNIVVWIASERVLFGGCVVKSVDAADLGNTADADLKKWPDAIRRIRQRYPAVKTVVPGHGAAGGPWLFAHTLELLSGKK